MGERCRFKVRSDKLKCKLDEKEGKLKRIDEVRGKD